MLLWLGPDLEQDVLVLLQPWIFQRPQHTIFVDSLKDASQEYLPIQSTQPKRRRAATGFQGA